MKPVFTTRNSDSVALVTALYHAGFTDSPDEHVSDLLAENAGNPAMMSMAFMTAMVLHTLPNEVAEQFLQQQGLWTSKLDAHFAELEAWVNWRPPKRRFVIHVLGLIILSFLNSTFVLPLFIGSTIGTAAWIIGTVGALGTIGWMSGKHWYNAGRPPRPDLPDIRLEVTLGE